MGILDQVAGALAGGKGAGLNAMVLQQLIAMLGKPGAIDHLLASFQKQGLGAIAQSWIGTGQNLPISPAQVQQALGSGTVADLAAKAGVQAPEAAQALAQLLPQVVDKLSPSGNEPAAGDLGGLLATVGRLLK